MPTIIDIIALIISIINFILSGLQHNESFITLGQDLGIHCLVRKQKFKQTVRTVFFV